MSNPDQTKTSERPRYPGERLRDIEREARGFLAWCREFVGSVRDTRGTSMPLDWEDQLASLEHALREDPE
jgi:hypothetical protein